MPYYLLALLAWLYFTLIWDVPILGSSGYTPLLENPWAWFTGLLLALAVSRVLGEHAVPPATPAAR